MSLVKELLEAFAEGFAPDPYLTITEWADKYRQLPRGASSEAGQYSSERMPYLREIMDELSPQSATQQVKVIKGTQLGFTEIGNNVVMYYMDVVPTSQLMILPNEQLVKDHSNRKLTPSLRAMPKLAQKISGGKSKDDIGAIFEKIYPGGMLKLAWSGSPANFRSLSCRVVVLDDVDGFPSDADGEGNPLDLGKKRTDSFGISRKIYINSTPTQEGESNIENEFEDSDQRHYYMPCPHCGESIRFEFEHFRFEYEKESYKLLGDVQFACYKCGSLIDEHHKTDMLKGGKWIPHNEGHIHRGYRLPAYYSPLGFVTWNEIIREFLEAKRVMKRGDIRKMKVWVNTRDAKVFEEEMDKPEVGNLSERKEEYGADVPDGVKVICAGVDTQDDRFELEVVGYGLGMESWSIDYKIIQGDPNLLETRKRLDTYLKSTFSKKDGTKFKIYATAIDTGGHRAKAVYSFCRPRATRRVFAIKGATSVDAPFVNMRSSNKNLGKIALFSIGVNAGKDDIYANLAIKEVGAGYMHFPSKEIYSDEYFKQLTAEKRDKKTRRWVKFRARNEAIDCRNYANAALSLAGIDESVLDRVKHIGVIMVQKEKKKPKKEYKNIKKGWLNGWKQK